MSAVGSVYVGWGWEAGSRLGLEVDAQPTESPSSPSPHDDSCSCPFSHHHRNRIHIFRRVRIFSAAQPSAAFQNSTLNFHLNHTSTPPQWKVSFSKHSPTALGLRFTITTTTPQLLSKVHLTDSIVLLQRKSQLSLLTMGKANHPLPSRHLPLRHIALGCHRGAPSPLPNAQQETIKKAPN